MNRRTSKRCEAIWTAARAVGAQFYHSWIDLDHFGIIDPGVAPPDHFHKIWEHYGMTTAALIQSIQR
jgi:hypothetical protein